MAKGAHHEAIYLGLFDLDNSLAFIGSTVQAGVMRQFELVALGTD